MWIEEELEQPGLQRALSRVGRMPSHSHHPPSRSVPAALSPSVHPSSCGCPPGAPSCLRSPDRGRLLLPGTTCEVLPVFQGTLRCPRASPDCPEWIWSFLLGCPQPSVKTSHHPPHALLAPESFLRWSICFSLLLLFPFHPCLVFSTRYLLEITEG